MIRIMRDPITHNGKNYDRDNFIKSVNESDGKDKDPDGKKLSEFYDMPFDPA